MVYCVITRTYYLFIATTLIADAYLIPNYSPTLSLPLSQSGRILLNFIARFSVVDCTCTSLLYVEYSPPGSNLLMFPCQFEEKSETIQCLDDDLLRELEEKLLERSQIMDPGVMAELVRELELANSKADVSLACTCIHSVNTV